MSSSVWAARALPRASAAAGAQPPSRPRPIAPPRLDPAVSRNVKTRLAHLAAGLHVFRLKYGPARPHLLQRSEARRSARRRTGRDRRQLANPNPGLVGQRAPGAIQERPPEFYGLILPPGIRPGARRPRPKPIAFTRQVRSL